MLGEGEGAKPFTELLGDPAAAPEVEIDPAADLAVLPYSSGTTGPAQGRDADPPQPGRQPRADPGRVPDRAGRHADRRAAVLPHLRDDRDHEPGPARRGDDRHDAALRPRPVPRADRRARRHPRLRRAADRARARQAPGGRRARPLLGADDHVGRRAARRRARRHGRRADRLQRDPGLRPDRDQPGHARDPPRRREQARLDRPAAAGHRVPARRPRDRRGRRRGRARRAVDPRPAGDAGLPQQRGGDARRRSTPTAGCTPATSPSSTPTATSRSSTGSRS